MDDRSRTKADLIRELQLLRHQLSQCCATPGGPASDLLERLHDASLSIAEIMSIYDHSGLGLCVLDLDMRFIRINDTLATFNGVAAADHLGKTVLEVVPDLYDSAASVFRRVLETGAPVLNLPFNGETQAQPGVVRHWVEHWLPLVLPDGETIGVSIIVDEVTARVHAERELSRINANLDRLVRERTVELDRRSGQLASLASELTMAEHRERQRVAQFLHDHLQQLLVGARMQAHAVSYQDDSPSTKALARLNDILAEAIATTRSLVHDLAPPIRLSHELAEGFRWLVRDAKDRYQLQVAAQVDIDDTLNDAPEAVTVLLFTAARELLLNVVKHAGTRRARLRLTRHERAVVLQVSDEGRGMDPSLINEKKPLGFGLFSIRERVELLDGTFELDSTPGRGLRVVVSVPLPAVSRPSPATGPAQPSIALSRAPEGESSPTSPPEAISVLFVDDHRIVRESLVNLLKMDPGIHVVGEAANGQEAIECVELLQPDVVIMDISMPVMDGIEATRIIKHRWPSIRVIGLSMFDDAERGGLIREAGADGYLSKSVPPEQLIEAIKGR